MTRSITILGATGSIGASTLDLIRREREQVARGRAHRQLPGGASWPALAREFGAEIAVVGDETCLPELREALAGTRHRSRGRRCRRWSKPRRRGADLHGGGHRRLRRACADDGGDRAGRAWSRSPTRRRWSRPGDVMTAAVTRHGATLLPTDTEHNAIFQCLARQRHRATCARSRSPPAAGRSATGAREQLRGGDAGAGAQAPQLGHGRQDQRSIPRPCSTRASS